MELKDDDEWRILWKWGDARDKVSDRLRTLEFTCVYWDTRKCEKKGKDNDWKLRELDMTDCANKGFDKNSEW